MAKPQACYLLAAYFVAARMTQEDVAQKVLGCVPSTLSSYMNGSTMFPPKYVAALAERFDIPIHLWGEVFILPCLKVKDLFQHTEKAG